MVKDSALLLVKSPNLINEYTRHGAAHIIRGLPIRVVYSGVWRYLQEYAEGSPLSLIISIVNAPNWLSVENSCKIRHYESFLEIPFFRNRTCDILSPLFFFTRICRQALTMQNLALTNIPIITDTRTL